MLEVAIKTTLGDFTLDAGFKAMCRGVTALFGPSGSGKTSLIKAIAGLLRADKGLIKLENETLFDSGRGINLPPERRGLGYVFQEGRLFPHLSVRSNLLYGMKLVTPRSRRIRPEQVIELMDIGPLLDRRPKNLSGGEKQRVAVGRALLTSPRLLLMDEPLASLDQSRKEELLPFLANLPRELDIPVVYVTHAQAEIDALSARVIPIKEGRVTAQ